jgi:hypothetical protein
MPNLGELASQLISSIISAVGSSSLRLGAAPTAAILLTPLVLLSLVARPGMRWTARDLGRLSSIRRAMALAAESGTDAVVSLGSAGLARASSAVERLQTVAAMPLLAHLARNAARAGVGLRVTVNDPIAAFLAEATLADAHERTATLERAAGSQVEYLGEGRPLSAAHALADAGGHGVAMVAGGLAEDSLLLLGGLAASARWSLGATASASEAASPVLDAEGALIGPELFQAAGNISSAGHTRTAVWAANRMIVGVIAVLVLGSLAILAGSPDLAGFLVGR